MHKDTTSAQPTTMDQQQSSDVIQPTSLKILSLNYQSICSAAKRDRFCALVYKHLPDIIIGCKSQIDNSYNSAEVFPPGYCVFRIYIYTFHWIYNCINYTFTVVYVCMYISIPKVCNMVLMLRSQRCKILQTVEQYKTHACHMQFIPLVHM